jgi:hypothetical protein
MLIAGLSLDLHALGVLTPWLENKKLSGRNGCCAELTPLVIPDILMGVLWHCCSLYPGECWHVYSADSDITFCISYTVMYPIPPRVLRLLPGGSVHGTGCKSAYNFWKVKFPS